MFISPLHSLWFGWECPFPTAPPTSCPYLSPHGLFFFQCHLYTSMPSLPKSWEALPIFERCHHWLQVANQRSGFVHHPVQADIEGATTGLDGHVGRSHEHQGVRWLAATTSQFTVAQAKPALDNISFFLFCCEACTSSFVPSSGPCNCPYIYWNGVCEGDQAIFDFRRALLASKGVGTRVGGWTPLDHYPPLLLGCTFFQWRSTFFSDKLRAFGGIGWVVGWVRPPSPQTQNFLVSLTQIFCVSFCPLPLWVDWLTDFWLVLGLGPSLGSAGLCDLVSDLCEHVREAFLFFFLWPFGMGDLGCPTPLGYWLFGFYKQSDRLKLRESGKRPPRCA